MLLAVVAGVAFAFIALAAARGLGPERGRFVLAVLLGTAAGVYLGAAIASGSIEAMVVQTVGAAIYAGVALLGFRKLRLLGIAWASHALWDLLHQAGALHTTLPDWYVWACVVADVTLGLFLLAFNLGLEKAKPATSAPAAGTTPPAPSPRAGA
jgi:hypothetical protein